MTVDPDDSAADGQVAVRDVVLVPPFGNVVAGECVDPPVTICGENVTGPVKLSMLVNVTCIVDAPTVKLSFEGTPTVKSPTETRIVTA